MASRYSDYINEKNLKNVLEQIEKKKDYKPYLATVKNSKQVLTDYDTFPYKRHYRGNPESSEPTVVEREAGWRPVINKCYRNSTPLLHENTYPDHCFRGSCNLTRPCRPEHDKSYMNKQALEHLINKDCIISYR